MEKSRTQELREKYGAKLEAIKELKREYYVGTSDIVDYLKSFESKDWPFWLAKEINKSLPENATYRATPDNVLELTALADGFISHYDNNDDGLAVEGNDFYDSLIRSVVNDGKGMLGALTKIYGKINEVGINDRVKATFTGLYLILQDIQNNSARVDESIAKLGLKDIASYLTSTGETDLYNNYSEFKRAERRNTITYNKVLSRIINDRVDTSFEYRRQVALLYAESSGAENHKELVRKAKKLAGEREDRLAIFKQSGHPIKTFIKTEEELVNKGKTLIQILQSEKRFLEKLYAQGEIN